MDSSIKLAVNLIRLSIGLQCALYVFTHTANPRELMQYSEELANAAISLHLLFMGSVLLGFHNISKLIDASKESADKYHSGNKLPLYEFPPHTMRYIAGIAFLFILYTIWYAMTSSS